MLDELRDAFRKAVRNFKTELHRDEVPETVDRLLQGMREELIDARDYIRRLENEIAKTVKLADQETNEAAVCRRREEMAVRIGDEETAAVAADFATKHERRREVLARKALALREEMEVREAEAQEMAETIKESRARRDELSATLGRATTRETIREADSLFDELDRMADKVSDLEGMNAARRELSDEALFGDLSLDDDFDPNLDLNFDPNLDLNSDLNSDPNSDPNLDAESGEAWDRRYPPAVDLEERLAELKRKMEDR